MNRRQQQSHSASFTLHGARVGEGIAIGHAHLFSTARLEVAHYEVTPDDVEGELHRLDRAFQQVRGELTALQAGLPAGSPPEMGAFLKLHAMILDDSNIAHAPRELVRERRYNAERALVQQMDELVAQFDRMEDPYLRERKHDVVQVVERVLKAMQGTGHAPAAPAHEEDVI